MALPVLDATFASSADLPRKQMLAKWLVSETGETFPSNVLVSGLQGGGPYVPDGPSGLYSYVGTENGKPKYEYVAQQEEPSEPSGTFILRWDTVELQEGNFVNAWWIFAPSTDIIAKAEEDTAYPWQSTVWEAFDVGSGSPVVTESPAPSPLSNYYSLPERYLWSKIAVAAGGPKTEADYISLPKNYVWSDIYNAVAGSSGNHTDWSENVALGHIAAAYRGDTTNPANLATYIDWPWRYKVASIIQALQ